MIDRLMSYCRRSVAGLVEYLVSGDVDRSHLQCVRVCLVAAAGGEDLALTARRRAVAEHYRRAA